jgi:hypothetical protein
VLEEADLHAIVRLQAHWQGHYQILVIDKLWQARRTRHDQGPITADSSNELWDKLRDDYAELAEYEKRLIALAAAADDPIFPALFMGGTAGVIVHLALPRVPLGLAFACLLAAVPGALVAAPFSMVLLAAFLTQVGALQTAPILIAVSTAFLAIEAVKYLVASRKKAASPGAPPASPGAPSASPGAPSASPG